MSHTRKQSEIVHTYTKRRAENSDLLYQVRMKRTGSLWKVSWRRRRQCGAAKL